jgi:hypothetical protein
MRVVVPHMAQALLLTVPRCCCCLPSYLHAVPRPRGTESRAAPLASCSTPPHRPRSLAAARPSAHALRGAHRFALAGWAGAPSATWAARARGAPCDPAREAGTLHASPDQATPVMTGGGLVCRLRRKCQKRTRCPVSRSLPARYGGTGPTLR